MKSGEVMEKICKIVYFDEDSVTDYVQIVAGGELENTTELLKSRDAQEAQSVQANGKVGISGIFKALLGWEAGASADVSAGLSFNSSKMVKNIVKNTILTDFLKTIEDVSQGRTNSRLPKGTIKQFKGYKISAVEDSLSYMVMVSPYLSMLKSGSSIPAGEFNIAVDKLDNALRHAKGYYEFVGTKGRSRVILRFNINSFRNSYTISDLLKMDLSIYAIKVILIDEFDKVNPAFYNAFYELFDEGRYVDTNYDVNLGQAIFLLTCNFGSEEEIKKILGPAMFSRIGCCIAYEELSTEQKQTIVHNWYESILSVLKADEKEEIEKTDILDWFIKNAERYDNIRILKTKLENAIFDRLSEVFIIS